jgi:hypothetical protein
LREQFIEDDHARQLADRVRLFIYAWRRPLRRLARDVDNVERFDTLDSPLPPHLRLACAAPPMTAPASAIVDAVVRLWGDRLITTEAGRLMVGTLAAKGPIAGAEAFALMWNGQQPGSLRLRQTADAFRVIFAQFPAVYLADARELLRTYALGLPDDGKEPWPG